MVAMLLLVLAACAQVRLPSENPEIVSFEASPAAITVGDSSTLSWEVEGADTVEIDGVAVDAVGTMTVSPEEDTTYTLVATNRRGNSEAQATIQVRQPDAPPLIAVFSAEPETVTAGDSSLLTWDVAGADNIRISPGIGTVPEASGSRTVAPENTTRYTLVAANAFGEVEEQVTVTVQDENADGTPVIAEFSANPEGIELGESSVLSWNVEGATDITISPTVGVVGSEGEHEVAPVSTTVYTLRATNDNGTSTRSATVHVREDPNSAPLIARFTASPSTVAPEGFTTLSWVVVGADTVTIDNGVGTVSAEGSISQQLQDTTKFTLTASNATGDRQNSVTIQVIDDDEPAPAEPVIAAFLADPASGAAPFGTNLYWVIKDPDSQIQNVDIAFGDGTNLEAARLEDSVGHTYTSEGVYTAVLTARLLSGEELLRATTVAVGADPAPQNPPQVNDFSVTPDSGRVPLDANFSFDVDGDGPLTCTINFGDGSAGQIIDDCATGNVGHRYMTPGVYTPSIVVNDVDDNVVSQEITVTVLPADNGDASLISDFTVAPDSGDAPLDVTFTWTLEDSAGSNVETWLFFGDGSIPETGSGSGDALHTYGDPGEYRALLLAVNEAGDYDISLVSVNVIDGASVPFAAVRTGSTLVQLDNDERGLLAPLLGGLLGSDADLSVLSNDSLLAADVNLFDMLDVLAIDLGRDSIEAVLLDAVDLGEIIEVLLSLTAGTGAELPLQDLLGQLPVGILPVDLGELINIDLDNLDDLRQVDLAVLDLLVVMLQVFNAQNVVGTPEPIEINLNDGVAGGLLDVLGLGGLITGGLSDEALARIHLQVVEAPAITFARVDQLGEASAGFRTAGVRLAVELEGIGLSIDPQDESSGLVDGLLNVITDLLDVLGALDLSLDLTLTDLSLFAEVGTYEGYVSDIDLNAPSVTVNSNGTLAQLHLGSIDPDTFFDRTRTSVPDVDFGDIATLDLEIDVELLTVPLASISGDVAVLAQASSSREIDGGPLVIEGPYPAGAQLASAGLGTLVEDLLADLELDVVLNLSLSGLGGLLELDQLVTPILDLVEEILGNVLGLTSDGTGLGASLPLDDLLEGLLDNLIFSGLGLDFNGNEITVLELFQPTP